MTSGQKVKVGDRIKDNDPRVDNRVLTVIEVGYTFVRARQEGLSRAVRIAPERIHVDDKPRRTGFSLLKNQGDQHDA